MIATDTAAVIEYQARVLRALDGLLDSARRRRKDAEAAEAAGGDQWSEDLADMLITENVLTLAIVAVSEVPVIAPVAVAVPQSVECPSLMRLAAVGIIAMAITGQVMRTEAWWILAAFPSALAVWTWHRPDWLQSLAVILLARAEALVSYRGLLVDRRRHWGAVLSGKRSAT